MENIKEYCYVMDFSDASLSEIKITEENKNLESCDLLDKYGFNNDECFYMFTSNRITDIHEINPYE